MDRRRPIVIDHVYLKNKVDKLLKVDSGHTPKALVLLEHKKEQKKGVVKACNSLFFGDLIKSLMSGNSAYSVYFAKDIVGKKKKDVVIPERIRCVVKKMESPHVPYYNGVVGSRLANLLGVPVVYNMAYQKEFEPEFDEQEYDYLLSVDYLPNGHKEQSLLSLGMHFGSENMLAGADSLEDVMTEVDRGLRRMIKVGTIKNDLDCIEAYREAMVQEYLFKNLLCEDGDYCSRNCNIVIAPNGSFYKAPCYDMELLFKGVRATGFYQQVAENDLIYLQQSMPDVLEDFLANCNKHLKSGAIDRVMDNSIKTTDRGLNAKLIVKRNIERLTNIYKKVKNSPEMGD